VLQAIGRARAVRAARLALTRHLPHASRTAVAIRHCYRDTSITSAALRTLAQGCASL